MSFNKKKYSKGDFMCYKSVFYPLFPSFYFLLAHLSWKVKWAFLTFIFISKTTTKLGTKHFVGKELNSNDRSFLKNDLN